MDLNTAGNPKLLAVDLQGDLYTNLDLSPDGGDIVYSSGIRGAMGIWVIGTDGTNHRQISKQGGSQLSWSPDGRKIAFLRDEPNWQKSLWQINPDGTGEEIFPTWEEFKDPLEGYNYGIQWSPDGTKLAFWSSK